MKAGLYGKLIAKRDFIAVDLPSGFLPKWEPWLHGAVTAANLQLGANWQRVFFTAPIWRFWLGRQVLGIPMLGVLMASMDGVGRQFPLCLIAPAPEGRVFRSPFQDPQSAWFEAAEDFLLSTLDEGVTYETTLQGLASLTPPEAILQPDPPDGVSVIPEGLLALTPLPDQKDLPLRLLQYARLQRDEPGLAFWWTIGGEGYPPTAFATQGLPEQALFLRMLASPVKPLPPSETPLAEAKPDLTPSDETELTTPDSGESAENTSAPEPPVETEPVADAVSAEVRKADDTASAQTPSEIAKPAVSAEAPEIAPAMPKLIAETTLPPTRFK